MRSNAKAIFKKIEARLNKAKNEVPKVLANVGQKHFNDQFKSESFEGHKWPEVKRREAGTFEYKYPKNKYLSRRTNPILIGKTRQLKNAVNRSIKTTNIHRIVWGIYGKQGKIGRYHNLGIGQKQRSFMRDSRLLRKKLKDKFSQIYKFNLR